MLLRIVNLKLFHLLIVLFFSFISHFFIRFSLLLRHTIPHCTCIFCDVSACFYIVLFTYKLFLRIVKEKKTWGRVFRQMLTFKPTSWNFSFFNFLLFCYLLLTLILSFIILVSLNRFRIFRFLILALRILLFFSSTILHFLSSCFICFDSSDSFKVLIDLRVFLLE
jgi:hypothetical protein